MPRIRCRHWVALPIVGAAFFAGLRMAMPADDEAVGDFLHETFDQTNSAIVVGLVDAHGSKIFAAGKLDNGSTNEVDGRSIFFIGSVSKTFTALLLQDMADRGEVSLDDPVEKYLPDSVKVPTFQGKQITLLDLATHTSGLPFNPSNMTGKDAREQYESYSVENMYEFLSEYKLPREPGKEFSYSNVGFALLGHALARRAGSDFETLVVERIGRPLAMEDTRNTLLPDQKARLAMGHEASGTASPPWKLAAYRPAGDIHSTANDLLKFVAAQVGLNESALTPTMKKTHTIRHQDTRGPTDLPGFGIFGHTAMDWVDRGAVQPEGMQLLGHAGGAGSYLAFVGFNEKDRRGVVVLTTDNEFSAEAIGWTLLQRLPLTRESAKYFARELVGIGTALELAGPSQSLRVTKVFGNSPARAAGILSGTTVQTIDGNPLAGKSLADCVALLRGPAGSTVRLDVVDPDGKMKTVELTRQRFDTTN